MSSEQELEIKLRLLQEDYDNLSRSYHNLMDLNCENDMRNILRDQNLFSVKTFGPGYRHDGIIDHILEEIDEIRKDPTDIIEWIDIAILALDGAFRCGNHTSVDVVKAYRKKLEINSKRNWPDWRTAEPGKAIKHIKS